MRVLLLGLIFLSPPRIKLLLLRWFCGARIGRHAHIGWFSAVLARHVELGEYSVVRPLTLIYLDGRVKVGDYSEISSFNLVYGSSSLVVGDQSYIGPQCLINADEPVRLGRESALGPRSMVFTHGSFFPYTDGYWTKLAGVTINDRVWCAAGVFIHPGVEIGQDTFVSSRSVLTQSVPAGSVVEGNPAQVRYPMERLKRKMSPRRVDAALAQVLHAFADIGLRRELEGASFRRCEAVQESKHELLFRWHGESYRVALIPSTGDLPQGGESDPGVRRVSGVRQVLLVNRPGWSSPPGAIVFDFETMRTPYAAGRVAHALRLFMKRYYGIKFVDQVEN
jgi:acetyltransferase-like isoleucine patch superfamily enzyme